MWLKEFKYLDRVEGLVYAGSNASQRVLEKTGFIREGFLKEILLCQGKDQGYCGLQLCRL